MGKHTAEVIPLRTLGVEYREKARMITLAIKSNTFPEFVRRVEFTRRVAKHELTNGASALEWYALKNFWMENHG